MVRKTVQPPWFKLRADFHSLWDGPLCLDVPLGNVARAWAYLGRSNELSRLGVTLSKAFRACLIMST